MRSGERGRYLAVVRTAFQFLFQVDLRGGRDADEVFALSQELPGGAGWRAAGAEGVGGVGGVVGGRALGAVEEELARRGLLPMDSAEESEEVGAAGEGDGAGVGVAGDARVSRGSGGGAGRWERDEGVRREAFELAGAAWRQRVEADKELRRLAPAWPAHRQPAVDRAILRLGWALIAHQVSAAGSRGGAGSGGVEAGAGGAGGVGVGGLDEGACVAAIDACVDLAGVYSTEKSPAFVNALLDKVYQRARGAGGE